MKNLSFAFIASALVLFTTPPGVQADFSWEMFVPVFTGAGKNAMPAETYWGALSAVHCTGSPTTFAVTAESVTKKSICQTGACQEPGNVGTFEGWVTTTEGTKAFSWTLSSACGSGGDSFDYRLEGNTTYRFTLQLNASNIPSVFVYDLAGQPPPTNREGITERSAPKNVFADDSWVKVDVIPIDISGSALSE